MVWMFISFIFASPWFPIPLSLPTDWHIHIFSVFIFLIHGDDEKLSFLILVNSFWIYVFKASMVTILYPVWSNSVQRFPVIFPSSLFSTLDTWIQNRPLAHTKRLPFWVDCLCHKHLFPYPLSLLDILETKIYIHSSGLF